METKRIQLFLAILFLPMFLACQEQPTAPTAPQEPAAPSERALSPILTISPSVLTLHPGEVGHFTTQILPYSFHAEAPIPDGIRWVSLDPDIASVDGSGTIRGLTRGFARVRAEAEDLLATAWVRVK